LSNVIQGISRTYYWGALKNTVYYIATVAVEFVIAFVLALLINAQIRARKFFRIAKKDCQSTCKTIKGK
jgi:multiple sugar transport system permease protein